MCKANCFQYKNKTDDRTILLLEAPMHIDEWLEIKDRTAILADKKVATELAPSCSMGVKMCKNTEGGTFLHLKSTPLSIFSCFDAGNKFPDDGFADYDEDERLNARPPKPPREMVDLKEFDPTLDDELKPRE
jgi:hypothetical protein